MEDRRSNTKHIEAKIHDLLNSGGIVIEKLVRFTVFLKAIRSIDSIRQEFETAFESFEKKCGDIMPATKTKLFLYIDDPAEYEKQHVS